MCGQLGEASAGPGRATVLVAASGVSPDVSASDIAKEAEISPASVQNIKKALGLVNVNPRQILEEFAEV